MRFQKITDKKIISKTKGHDKALQCIRKLLQCTHKHMNPPNRRNHVIHSNRMHNIHNYKWGMELVIHRNRRYNSQNSNDHIDYNFLSLLSKPDDNTIQRESTSLNHSIQGNIDMKCLGDSLFEHFIWRYFKLYWFLLDEEYDCILSFLSPSYFLPSLHFEIEHYLVLLLVHYGCPCFSDLDSKYSKWMIDKWMIDKWGIISKKHSIEYHKYTLLAYFAMLYFFIWLLISFLQLSPNCPFSFPKMLSIISVFSS